MVFILLSASFNIACAQVIKNNTANVVEKSISAEASLQSNGGAYTARFRLQPLDAGSRCNVKIKLTNPTKNKVKFDKIKTSCQCGSLTFDSSEVPGNGEITGELVWKVPSSSQNEKATVSATMYFQNSPIVDLKLEALLKGNFHVGHCGIAKRVDGGLFRWHIPVGVTSPLKLDNLKITLSEQLDGFTVSLDKEKESGERKNSASKNVNTRVPQKTPTYEAGRVVIYAHESMVGNEFRFGEISIADKTTKKRVIKELTLFANPPIVVSPRLLDFKDDLNDDSDDLVAKVFVQLDSTYFPENEQRDTESSRISRVKRVANSTNKTAPKRKIDFSAKLMVSGEEVDLEVKRIGSRVVRIRATCSAEAFHLFDTDATAVWLFKANQRDFEVPSKLARR